MVNMPTAEKILLGYGVVTVGTTPIGLTRGGSAFTVEREYRNIEADGDYGPVKGRIVIDKETAKLTVNALELFNATDMSKYYPAMNIALNTGTAEVASLIITTAANTAGNVTITLNGVAVNIAVLATDTAVQVADKIRNGTFSGWTTGGTAGTTTVTFTATAVGLKTDAIYSPGSTGATGSMITTVQGKAASSDNIMKSTLTIALGDYNDVKWVGKTKDGKAVTINVKDAINLDNLEWTLEDKNEVVPSIGFTATYDEATRTTPPWSVEYAI
jgi:hypothetical protein